jgi:hypothetical protein
VTARGHQIPSETAAPQLHTIKGGGACSHVRTTQVFLSNFGSLPQINQTLTIQTPPAHYH